MQFHISALSICSFEHYVNKFLVLIIFTAQIPLWGMAESNGGITGSIVVPTNMPDQYDARGILQGPVIIRLWQPDNLKNYIKETFLDNKELAFKFDNVKPGAYFISVSRFNFIPHSASVIVKEGQYADVGKQILLPIRKCQGPFTQCGTDSAGTRLWGSAGNPPEWNPKSIDAQLRSFNGSPVMTVCEYIKMRLSEPVVYSDVRAYVIGNLKETPDGSWLHQSCSQSLKSGDFTWPNAIALADEIEIGDSKLRFSPVVRDNVIRIFNTICKELESKDQTGPCAVVYGKLETRDNLIAKPCGNKLCGFGFGSISAPAQLIEKPYLLFR
jgi:hypothetical protein